MRISSGEVGRGPARSGTEDDMRRKNGINHKTIEHVAKKAGVSMMTVSRAISAPDSVRPATREKIYKVINAIGYRPHPVASALAKKNTRVGIIGVCLPSHHFLFTVDYYLRLFRGIEDAVEKRGYDLLIYNTIKKSGGAVDYARFQTCGFVDGLIVVAPPVGDPNLDQLCHINAPFIIASARPVKKGMSFVDADNRQGAFAAVEHLVKLGHRRIATIAGDLTSSNGIDRVAGYRKAMKKHGLAIHDELIVSGDWQLDEGYQAMKKLLALKKKPTAVFCANDFMAVMAMRAIREAGMNVPRDIAIVGYDDNDFCIEKRPPLTSVRQPCYEMGKIACEKVIDFVEEKKRGPVAIMLANQLMVRKSCGSE